MEFISMNLIDEIQLLLRKLNIMNFFEEKSIITITCLNRLQPYVVKEIYELNFDIVDRFATGVRVMGTMKDCIRLNLQLTCASSVLYSIGKKQIENPDELYEWVLTFPWEKILMEDVTFSITSNVHHPTINNNLFANLRVKDGVNDRLRSEIGDRYNTHADLSQAVIHLYWNEEGAELFIDTSGKSLGRHGYRKFPGKAPMLESLAAGCLRATVWDKVSPLVTPMCGTGTVAIEAAMQATNTKPGMFRYNYSFMYIQGYRLIDYRIERAVITKMRTPDVPTKIIASDMDWRMIDMAKKNAEAAHMEHIIEFRQEDFRKTRVPEIEEYEKGIVFFNPEYGERLGEVSELEKTYKAIGDYMKNEAKNYTGYIFTGNLELAKHIGLKAKRRIEFYNGKLDCRLLEYDLY